MRIAIDARMIKPGYMHGIARYVFQLLECFRTSGKEHEFFILINPDNPLTLLSWPAHMQLIPTPAKWISFREQWELPRLLRRLKVELFHAPSFVAPIACPCPLVMTIHDLNHLVLPQFYTPLHLFYYQTFVKSCVEKSKFLLTVSHFSKAEIVKHLGVAAQKVHVTYNGVSPNYSPVLDPQWRAYIQDIYGLPEDFILCLSNNKPHKNVPQLVRAYCSSRVKLPLVLASTCDPSLIRLAEKYGKKQQLYFTKFIAEQHLPSVYSMSRVFVYPSTYEGFGLPPLEALACGAPVVVAKSASLPEVVGAHATYMDPYDFQSIAQALEKAIDLTAQADYKRQQQASIKHAQQFSWQFMAQKTLDLYQLC